MSWELALQIIQTAAVVLGVVFGLIQLRQLRAQREVQAGIELLHPLQAPESVEAIMLVYSLPENLSGEQVRERLGDHFGTVLGVLGLFESLGPLVARGHVPIEMYSDFYRGSPFCVGRSFADTSRSSARRDGRVFLNGYSGSLNGWPSDRQLQATCRHSSDSKTGNTGGITNASVRG